MKNKPVTLDFYCDYDETPMQVAFQECGNVVFVINDMDGNDQSKQVSLGKDDLVRLHKKLSSYLNWLG